MIDRIKNALLEMQIDESEEKARLLEEYLDEIYLFNPTLKLVGEKEKDQIISRHILDSLSAYKVFLEYSKKDDIIADLGSGAGLPGIVLAIIFKDRNFVLIERMTRRANFLKGVVAKLKLKNVTVLNKDINDIDEKYRILTCRAFHPLTDIADSAISLLALDGVALFYKAKKESVDQELSKLSQNYIFDFTREKLNASFVMNEREILVLKGWKRK